MRTQKITALCLTAFLIMSGSAVFLGRGHDTHGNGLDTSEELYSEENESVQTSSSIEGKGRLGEGEEAYKDKKEGLGDGTRCGYNRSNRVGKHKSTLNRGVVSEEVDSQDFAHEGSSPRTAFLEHDGIRDRIKKRDIGTYEYMQDKDVEIETEGNYTDHTVIRIDGDSDLNQTAESEGWPGNGSENAPYIIEDYDIDGEDRGYCIYIGNVTEHLVIKDCYLHNASGRNVKYAENTGLFLFNVSNSRVENNTLLYNRKGIVLRSSKNSTVLNNTVEAPFDRDEPFLPFESRDKSKERSIQEYPAGWKDAEHYSSESVLVRLRPELVQRKLEHGGKKLLKKEVDSFAQRLGASASRIFEHTGAAELKLRKEIDVKNTIEELKDRPEVRYAEPNYYVDIESKPDDPGFDSLWGMQKVKARDAWNVTKGSGDVVIAVIDTGVDYNHLDLQDNIWTGTTENGTEYHGYNAINDSYCPMDNHGHGTHVAGTIGAVGNNSKGVVGINWNVSVMPVKFLDAAGRGTTADAIECFEFVLERKQEGANVIATSNSWGGGGKSKLMKEAIAKNRDAGILCIAAAGNDWSNNDVSPSYPANYDLTNIVSVAATKENDELASFSNYGNRSVHVAAPGVDINSTLPDGEYGEYSGTSMATPHVSGLAGLLAAGNSSYSYTELKNILLSSVDPLESLENLTMTEGRINASRALNTSPDPDDINFRVHRPLSSRVNEETKIIISLDNDIEPVTGKNVTVSSSFDKEKFYLRDDGTGADQVSNDGYYTASWTPVTSGKINLTIKVRLEEKNLTRKLHMDIWGDTGVSVQNSSHCLLEDISVTQYDMGVGLSSSSDISMLKNNATLNQQGFTLRKSSGILLSNSSVSGNDKGLYLEEAENNTISYNEVLKNVYGMDLQNSINNSIVENNITAQWVGAQVMGSDQNDLYHNSFADNIYGIGIVRSDDCDFVENQINSTIGDMWYGLVVSQSNGTLVKDNKIERKLFGIDVWQCGNNRLLNNTLTSQLDIGMSSVCNLTLVNNTMQNGVHIGGKRLDHWMSHSIGPSNTIRGTPLYYWKNRTSVEAPEDIHQIILVNCTDVDVTGLDLDNESYVPISGAFSDHITVSRNDITNNTYGVYLMESENNTIRRNNISHSAGAALELYKVPRTEIYDNTFYRNGKGIYADFSDEVQIYNNTISYTNGLGIFDGCDISLGGSENSTVTENMIMHNRGDGEGIFLPSCKNSRVTDNIIRDNTGRGNGIYLQFCSGIYVSENIVTDMRRKFSDALTSYHNGNGIYLGYESHDNIIFNNTVVENEGVGIHIGNDHFDLEESNDNILYSNNIIDNERQASDNGENQWYNGTTGNYWSNYEERYPKARALVDEGIWDKPYNITKGNNSDEYPLLEPTKPMVSIEYPINYDDINTSDITVNWTVKHRYGSDLEYEIRVDEEVWRYAGSLTRYDLTNLSDGYHHIEVRVIGYEKVSLGSLHINVDTSKPGLNILYPKVKTEFGRNHVNVDWNGVSNGTAIEYYEVKLGEGNWTDVGLATEYELLDLKDGNCTFKVRATDRAGNTAEKEVSLLIDTAPPDLDITKPGENALLKEEDVRIDWESSDNVSGVSVYRMSVDGAGSLLVKGYKNGYTVEDLEDGKHTVRLEVGDRLQNTVNETINFTVDTTMPDLEITKPEEGRELDEDDVKIGWNCTDEMTGVDHYEVRIEGEEWKDLGENRTYTFEDLEDGSYDIEVRAFDGAGNERLRSVSFTVKTTDWWVIGFVLASLVIFLLMLVYILKLNRDMTFVEDKLQDGFEEEEAFEDGTLEEEGSEQFLEEDDISSKRVATEGSSSVKQEDIEEGESEE